MYLCSNRWLLHCFRWMKQNRKSVKMWQHWTICNCMIKHQQIKKNPNRWKQNSSASEYSHDQIQLHGLCATHYYNMLFSCDSLCEISCFNAMPCSITVSPTRCGIFHVDPGVLLHVVQSFCRWPLVRWVAPQKWWAQWGIQGEWVLSFSCIYLNDIIWLICKFRSHVYFENLGMAL